MLKASVCIQKVTATALALVEEFNGLDKSKTEIDRATIHNNKNVIENFEKTKTKIEMIQCCIIPVLNGRNYVQIKRKLYFEIMSQLLKITICKKIGKCMSSYLQQERKTKRMSNGLGCG